MDEPCPEGDQAEQMMFGQIEVTLSRERYEHLIGLNQNVKKVAPTNKGKHFMIFNDQSGSMSGDPFECLKEANLLLADPIYNGGCKFESVEVVFYESYVHPVIAKDKAHFQKIIRDAHIRGGTCFSECFRHIRQRLERAKKGDEFTIIFFTDG